MNFKNNKTIIKRTDSQIPTDSINGFSNYFKKETLYLISPDHLGSDEIKQ
jgi:hypothetical protein